MPLIVINLSAPVVPHIAGKGKSGTWVHLAFAPPALPG
ncbi:hypothetical protein CSE45_1324 [Citreicella sp. SE45]|nr:hypothetical protein CSE45_1324 [Citreicella sp. SE45]